MRSRALNGIFICLICCVLFTQCNKSYRISNENISLLCLRDSNAIHLKILNRSRDTIFVPSQFIGTYKIGGDTIFLETVDGPRFGVNYFYRYDNLMPFEFYTAQLIENQQPDSVVKIVTQTSYFNQFGLGRFEAIFPDSSYYQAIKFNVPQKPLIVSAVLYEKYFYRWIGKDSASFRLEDFEKFDSQLGTRICSKIIDRYY